MADFHDQSEATAVRDATAERALAFDLTKCQVDPIAAQDNALLAVALKLREGRLAVNDVQLDEARTTMIRSNYAPDWTKAHWDHPLMANLKNLSCLSTADFPSVTKRGLVDERKAMDRVGRSIDSESSGGVDGATAAGQQSRALVSTEARDRLSLDAVRAEVADAEVIQRAIDHGVSATIEASSFIVHQGKALLQLSSETINSDPQLLALVSAVAQANKSDPVVAARVALGDTPTIPVTVVAPSVRNVPNSRRKATDALPQSGPGDYNRGFRGSDIADYDHLRHELSPDRNQNPRSMHDVGAIEEASGANGGAARYRTWCEKHLEQPSGFEDMERYSDYREAVTTLEGRCASITSRTQWDSRTAKRD